MRQQQAHRPDYSRYRDDPVGFCTDVLGIQLWEHVADCLRGLIEPPYRVSVDSGHGIGKAQPVDTVIETPNGARRLGDILPGDFVFGRSGLPTRVLAVFPQGVRQQYRVTLDDGSSTLADANHLWVVRGRQGRRYHSQAHDGWETLTTAEILTRGVTRPNGVARARQLELPHHAPVEYPSRSLPIPAYTLGAWLGDGGVGTGRITSADPEMPDYLSQDGGEPVKVYMERSGAKSIRVPGLSRQLRLLGILRTPTDQKSVPRCYLESSVGERLRLLQGLMDTDGTVGKNNSTATFCSTSRALVADVAWLVRSLGGKATLHKAIKQGWYRDTSGAKVICKKAYEVTVRLPDLPLFRLVRKQSRVTAGEARYSTRWIASIVPEGTAEMVCIQVAATDQLYLTNDFIVTHNTHGAACAVLWWYYTRPQCWIISTAPTQRDVCDLLWTEVRLLRQRALRYLPDDFQPAAPEMRSGPEHVAKGYTARDANSAQGRHRPNMLFIFDEKEGVTKPFWDGVKSMFRPGSGDAVLAIGNPLTTTSIAYQEHNATDVDGNPLWNRKKLSCLDHPNILAGLRGEPLPMPGAVTLGQIEMWLADWCDPVIPGDERAGDIAWPPVEFATALRPTRYHRPGPIGQPRILGIRPSSGTFGIWSEALWQATLGAEPAIPRDCRPIIGCDVATFGADYTVFHVRCGPVSLLHQAVNGWEHDRIAHRLKELAEEYAAWLTAHREPQATPILARDVAINIDDDATGRAVSTLLEHWGLQVYRLNAQATPVRPDLYPNRRSELWFTNRNKAALGQVNVARLERQTRHRLELQCLAPQWWPDHAGRRVVESKDDLRKPDRLGRSPDDADAFNLAYADTAAVATAEVLPVLRAEPERRDSRERKPGGGLFTY